MSEASKSFEVALTILIALSAAMVGATGYLSAQMHTTEDEARAVGIAKLNEANTAWINANQEIYLDHQYYVQAVVESYAGREDAARYLRSSMRAVQWGFFDEDGNPAAVYNGNYTAAWDDFYKAEYDYYQYGESKLAADAALAEARAAGQKSLSYLLYTVLLAIATMIGTVGMSAKARQIRLVFLILGILFLASSSILIAYVSIT